MDGTNSRYRRTEENKMPYRIILVLRVIHPLKNVHITQKAAMLIWNASPGISGETRNFNKLLP